jgi:cell division septation protein DedD
VVQADDRPVRVKPENPGGLQVAGINNEIYNESADDSAARLAPAPEVPNPAALQAAQPRSKPVPPEAPPAHVTQQAATAARVVKPETAPPPAAPARPAAVTPARPPAVAKAEQARPAAAPAPTAEKRPATGGRVAVQLAALSSEDGARTAWRTLSKRMPELLGSRQPVYARAERDGKVFWRVRTGGFSDLTEARGFCDQVRAKGGACTVAEF